MELHIARKNLKTFNVRYTLPEQAEDLTQNALLKQPHAFFVRERL